MPFEIRFSKKLEIKDSDKYINECCIGGDLVLAEIEKAGFVSDKTNEKVSRGQEDWGWYLWFWRGNAKFEVNICFDNEEEVDPAGYRIHIIRQIKAGLFSKKMEDTDEVGEIKDEVKERIERWTGKPCVVEKIKLD